MSRPACESCRFYYATEQESECRRYPPVLAWFKLRRGGDDPEGFTVDISEGTEKYAFPSIDSEAWCGEHQPKERMR